MKILTFTVEPATGKKFISNANQDEFKAFTTPVFCDGTIVGTISRNSREFWVPPIPKFEARNFDLETELDDNELIQRVYIRWKEPHAGYHL